MGFADNPLSIGLCAQLACVWEATARKPGNVHRFRDFADTAAVVSSLDAVISVDSAVAHLAGAMGKPLFLLLPFGADFRWLRERRDSPWYPTAQLFRQPKFGDWDSVIETLARELRTKFSDSARKLSA